MLNHKELIQSVKGYAVIYLLTSPSGKRYVGQTFNFDKRYSDYRRNKQSSIGKKLRNALWKYSGIENFDIKILATIETTDNIQSVKVKLNELEIFYIQEYDTFKSGYNSTAGGEGSVGRVTSEETKERISKGNKGKRAVDDIECTCGNCGKKFWIQPHSYRLRIKRSKSSEIFCSMKCRTEKTKPKQLITYKCVFCGKEHTVEQHHYNKNMRNSKSKKLFCDAKCYKGYLRELKTNCGMEQR